MLFSFIVSHNKQAKNNWQYRHYANISDQQETWLYQHKIMMNHLAYFVEEIEYLIREINKKNSQYQLLTVLTTLQNALDRVSHEIYHAKIKSSLSVMDFISLIHTMQKEFVCLLSEIGNFNRKQRKKIVMLIQEMNRISIELDALL